MYDTQQQPVYKTVVDSTAKLRFNPKPSIERWLGGQRVLKCLRSLLTKQTEKVEAKHKTKANSDCRNCINNQIKKANPNRIENNLIRSLETPQNDLTSHNRSFWSKFWRVCRARPPKIEFIRNIRNMTENVTPEIFGFRAKTQKQETGAKRSDRTGLVLPTVSQEVPIEHPNPFRYQPDLHIDMIRGFETNRVHIRISAESGCC